MATCVQWRMIGAFLCVLGLARCGSKPEPVAEEPVQMVGGASATAIGA